jgi:hypothetical protein
MPMLTSANVLQEFSGAAPDAPPVLTPMLTFVDES